MSFQTRLLQPQAVLSSKTSSQSMCHDASTTTAAVSYKQLLLLNSFNSERYPYLLASSANAQNNTQFDILLACPQFHLQLTAEKKLYKISADGDKQKLSSSAGFLSTLETYFQNDKVDTVSNPDNLPFTGGWFLYLSYEMAEEIEPRLSLAALTKEQPLAVASRCPAAVIVDKKNNRIIAIAETEYAYLLDEIEHDFAQLSHLSPDISQCSAAENKIELVSMLEADSAPYLKQVEKIKQYIVDGDIFQANLSRKWQAIFSDSVTDTEIFEALAQQNPSSFAALACLNDVSIISSSPERLVSLKDGIVETRPIAGTRPRDNNLQDDAALARELLAHPKEQAEHIMLIDLERNDLGRVCRPGSIEVNELMTLESWQHVHHIVSNVRGELLPDKSAIDVIRAVFPGGTITGCPKVRCMEILAEMEQQARGAYTGSLGYLNNDGSMDLNILIRTMVRTMAKAGAADAHSADSLSEEHHSTITFRAGGGIVSDSVAENELAETRAKAKGLLNIFINRQRKFSKRKTHD